MLSFHFCLLATFHHISFSPSLSLRVNNLLLHNRDLSLNTEQLLPEQVLVLLVRQDFHRTVLGIQDAFPEGLLQGGFGGSGAVEVVVGVLAGVAEEGEHDYAGDDVVATPWSGDAVG